MFGKFDNRKVFFSNLDLKIFKIKIDKPVQSGEKRCIAWAFELTL